MITKNKRENMVQWLGSLLRNSGSLRSAPPFTTE